MRFGRGRGRRRRAADVTPLGASFGTAWTSQVLVLADFFKVAEAEPSFAEDYYSGYWTIPRSR